MKFPPIVIATNNGDIGGGEVMLLRIVEALRELDVRVSVVAPTEPSGLADAADEQGFATVRLPATGRREWMLALRRWDRRERHGILWCNGLVPAAATAGRPARIVHLHQKPLDAVQKLLVPIARYGAMATLVPSKYMQKSFRGSIVLPNWTGPVAETTRVRRPEDPYVVGFLGRLSTDKGIVTLARAMQILERQEPGKYQLLVAGEPRFVDAKDYAKVDRVLNELGDLVERPGWMDRDEFFSKIDLFAMPSQWGEPFGLGAVEAMAAKVPLVVTNDGALPEIVGGLCSVVQPGDYEMLACAIGSTTTDQQELGAYACRSEFFSEQTGRDCVGRFLRDLTREATPLPEASI